MFNLILLLFISFLPSDLVPVLHEGRFRPNGALETSVEISHEEAVSQLEEYKERQGTIYQKGHTQHLRYPTINQLRAELFYTKTPLLHITLFLYIMTLFFIPLKKRRLMLSLFFLAYLCHTLLMALRIYILGRPPVANMYETILYVPWIASGASLIYYFASQAKHQILLLSSTLLAIALFLLLPSGQSLENVQAVLNSRYWLMIHVMLIVGSYGILLFAGILAHFQLINPKFALEKPIYHALFLGTFFLICGTILGGIWAQQSWGRFWDWDPKEAWAFISCGINILWIHAYRYKKISIHGLSIGAIISLMSISFTWYGVNYILGTGLHSYGFGSGGQIYYFSFLVGEVIFLAIYGIKNEKLKKKSQPGK